MKIIITILLTALVAIQFCNLVIYYEQVGGNLCL
jgi:hypothetical protein